MAALGEARLREMEALRALRLANEGKLLAPSPDTETRVCLCHKAPAAPMVQCELCRDAFHTGCVAAPSAPHGPRVWLCPHCRRSEKPPLERVLPLLASLQRIRVRLPEGDALRYVIERTVSWQHRAQQLLASGGLRPAHDRGGPGRPQSRGQASAGQASDSKAPLPPGTASPPLPDGRDSRTSLALSPFAAGRSCVPLHGVSAEVNELLMEAHLLQVSLPEVHELYRTLLARPSPPPRTEQNSPARPGSEKQDCCRGKRDGVSSLERKLKRRLERDGHASERWDRVRKTRAPRRKKVRRSRPEATDAVLSESTRGCEPARTGGTHPPPSDTSCSEQEDSEAEEAICPAVSCLQPEGDEVDWVQCDGSCNQWFHQVCVGVSPEMAEKEDYVCVRCTVRDAPSRK